MEAEVIALAHSCSESLPIIDVVASLSDVVDLPKDFTSMHVLIHEAHASMLIWAEIPPPQYMS